MIAVTRIKRLRGCGVFRDFTWPSDLPDFARYNLVYGWNWSGKTTLSRILRALESRAEPPEGQVTLTVDGRDVRNDDFAGVMLGVRVFNRDFVAESVFPTDGEVAPILVLGKRSVEKQKQIEGLRATLSSRQTDLAKNRGEEADAQKALSSFCTDQAGVIRSLLRSSGISRYNNYDKRNFQDRVERMTRAKDRQAHEVSEDHRQKLMVQLRQSPKAKLSPLTYQLPDLTALKKAVVALLSTTVVSSVVESLKDDAGLSSWVHSGLLLHRERDTNACLFCSQQMPTDRLAVLEAHFSAQYEDLLRKLDHEITGIQTAIRAATELATPKPAELHDYLLPEFEAATAALRCESDSVKRILDALAAALGDKKTRMFERVALHATVGEAKAGVVDSLNAVIQKHNRACDDSQSRIASARTQIEADSVAANLDGFVKRTADAEAAKRAVKEAENEITRLTEEIGELEREIVLHRQPAEELNEDLRSYLGHSELRLEVEATGYRIMRHDSPAHSLSEGESSAIGLLYFLKSLRDRSFDLGEGVVVLDDPVSSLDANALYSAFGFIRERTQDAGQLIILTHNFTFFRQVRNWYHHLTGQRKSRIEQRPARFYMLNCTHGQQHRSTRIQWLDPLLEQFDSEYHYLFAYTYRAARDETGASLEQNYVLPNLARRLLESFLAFRQPQVSHDLASKLDLVDFDEAKKIRIIRFLHTHSHSGDLGEPEHDLSLLAEAPAVLRDLFDLMKAEDPTHFSAMESLVTASTAIEEEEQ